MSLVKQIRLKLILFLLIGIILGILSHQWIIPRLEGFFYSETTFQPFSSIMTKGSVLNNIGKDCENKEKTGKAVEVNLSDQEVRMCEDGKIIGEFSISGGKQENPTPSGSFKVIHKSLMIYSKIAECWLPFWVGFNGNYGFHEVPICDDEEKRVGEEQIGQPASLGCIRLKIGEAEEFYNWVEIGTEIEVY